MNNTINWTESPTAVWAGEEEIKAAVKACCGRCCNACESPFEYAMRKRNTDLSDILDAAIENELSENEKSVIKDIYFGNMSSSGVAAKYGITKSTVNATRLRAEKKLHSVLRYVRMYQEDCIGEKSENLLRELAPVICARHCIASGLSSSLRNARLGGSINIALVSESTGIDGQRIREFESGEAVPGIGELKALCIAYGTTPDVLLGFERKE